LTGKRAKSKTTSGSNEEVQILPKMEIALWKPQIRKVGGDGTSDLVGKMRISPPTITSLAIKGHTNVLYWYAYVAVSNSHFVGIHNGETNVQESACKHIHVTIYSSRVLAVVASCSVLFRTSFTPSDASPTKKTHLQLYPHAWHRSLQDSICNSLQSCYAGANGPMLVPADAGSLWKVILEGNPKVGLWSAFLMGN
jgi:hypothetical protein